MGPDERLNGGDSLRRVGLLAVALQRLKPVSNSMIYIFIFDALREFDI
jgi:hypothetical protein